MAHLGQPSQCHNRIGLVPDQFVQAGLPQVLFQEPTVLQENFDAGIAPTIDDVVEAAGLDLESRRRVEAGRPIGLLTG